MLLQWFPAKSAFHLPKQTQTCLQWNFNISIYTNGVFIIATYISKVKQMMIFNLAELSTE